MKHAEKSVDISFFESRFPDGVGTMLWRVELDQERACQDPLL